MSSDLIQYAFVAGEISPKLLGRSDYEKYDFGLKSANNWFVDYRGGLSTRPGQSFVDFLEAPNSDTRSFRFQYSPDTANSYVVIFGDGYVRFVQSGAYVLEADLTISDIASEVITSTSHGLANGDWIKLSAIGGTTELNGRTFEVANVTTHTFTLVDVVTGAALDWTDYSAYTSGGTINRIYTIASPYAAADLQKLKAYQIRDYLRLTHADYPIKNLVRSSATSWAISDEAVGSLAARPENLAVTPSTSGSAGMVFAVTAVMSTGEESIASDVVIEDASVDYTVTAGYAKLTWDPVDGAAYYNIYRSLVLASSTVVHGGMQLGYIGKSYAPQFVDNNIIPDFTVSPPQGYNPFADGAITSIEVTNGGSSYTSAPAVSVSGSGSGFVGFAVLDGDAVVAVVILARGSGYVNPTVSFTGGGGSGAAATAVAGAADGNSPATSIVFQQRQIYAATNNQPLTIFGSRPGQPANFDVSAVQNDGDSFEYDLDSPSVAPIRHLISMRGGLIVMSAAGIWQLTAGGNNSVLTPTNALAEPQTYTSCADIPPLFVDTDLLYVTEKESIVRLLSYNDYSKLYGGQDMSILSNHLFSADNPVVRWTYAETPYRIVYAIRQDGTRLDFTVVKEQEVFAWTRASTEGYYRDIVTVEESGKDVTYVTVERFIGGNKVKTLEQIATREITVVEDVICSDAALVLPATYPNTTLILSGTSETITITAGSATFTEDSVGDIIRAGGGKIEITAYTSTTVVTGYVLREVTEVIPETTTPKTFLAGEWTLDTPVNSVEGLWHLEGKTVKVLADGSVNADAVVTGGAIDLDAPATRVVVGLGYTCTVEALPPVAPNAIIEGRRKDVVGVAVRLHESRGLAYGRSLAELEEMVDRQFEPYGEPTELQTGVVVLPTDGNWDYDATMFYRQSYPLPATILGLVLDLEVGDDRD